MRPTIRTRLASTTGFSLAEMMVSMGILTVVLGATLGGLADVSKSNEIVLQMSGMNNAVRSSMDLIIRDMLQTGSGLPSGHNITIPSGLGSARVKIPGPPGTAFVTSVSDTTLAAVLPRPNLGPTINGAATDVVSVIMADNSFVDVALSAVTNTTVDIAAGPNISTGPDRVSTGQLMMISKGSRTSLVQVTTVNLPARRLTFADGDSLGLNQSGAAAGNLGALNAAAPANNPASTRISRVRMITYYLDATIDPKHPRLVRRINNGHPTSFDNTLGTTVAIDIENLKFTYDISNGTNDPGNVAMVAADLGNGGACAPAACAPTQIRKMNIVLTGRTPNAVNKTMRIFRNTLQSQVSLRGMAFVDKYRG